MADALVRTIEYRSDGGDFAEVWVNGKRATKLNSDEDDLDTAYLVVVSIAAALGIASIGEEHRYSYDAESGELKLEE